MAHELEIKADGTASMFSGEGITPWHGLGTVIEGMATAEEALELSGLDWEVTKEPVYQKVGDDFLQIPDRYSNVRSSDNKSLGIVSANYHVYQNREAFNFLNEMTDTGTGDAIFSTAGSLFGGARTFITVKIGDQFTVGDNDAHDLYLMVTNSHDGSQAFNAAVTPIRAVCNNTVTLGMAQAATKWSLTHRAGMEGRVANARETLELSFRYMDAFEEQVAALMEVEMVKDQFYKLVDNLVPASKLQHDKDVDTLMDIWETEPTVKAGGGEGNGWGAFNAITFWTDHSKNYRNNESRFKSIIGTGVGTGLGEKIRPKAEKMILALA